MTDSFDFTPLIIVGAGRSGTNILRDTLCRLPGFATWDCDEINPIWRHGNTGLRHDEFSAVDARPSVKRFIRKTFAQFWAKAGQPAFVVEKTCANSLRVPFIDAVLPEAKFLFIVRDGADVVASAGKRWRGELELEAWPYYLAKIRNTPLTDIPLYGWSFLRARIGRAAGARSHLAFWGPRANALSALPADASLEERCAVQWAACVDKADADLREVAPNRVLRLSYEAFTADPTGTVRDVLAFLGGEQSNGDIARACAGVSRASVGKGRASGEIDPRAQAAMAATLERMGYGRRTGGRSVAK